MARLVMAASTPHNPLLWRTMTDPLPDDLTRTHENFARIRQAVADLRVDTLVVIGSDHLRQFFADNCPAFTVGMAAAYHGTFDNEVRTFGVPRSEIVGCPELARVIAGTDVLPDGFDFATSHEWRLDHSYVVPLRYVTPELTIPVVPINTNCVLPPLPGPKRFAALGEHLRRSIDAWQSHARVGILTSGHMANEIGGPRQFLGGGSADAEFDADAVAWMRDGDLDAAIAGCTFDRLMRAGNMTYQFVNALVALAAMDRQRPELAEATPSRFSPGSFFLWRAS